MLKFISFLALNSLIFYIKADWATIYFLQNILSTYQTERLIMSKKTVLTLTMLAIAASVSAAPKKVIKTTVVKLTANPEYGPESFHIQTNKGNFGFYVVHWDNKSFDAIRYLKRGQCLKIFQTGHHEDDIYVRKVKCPAKF